MASTSQEMGSVAETIASLRRERGLSIEQLAEKSGMPMRHVADFEAARRETTLLDLVALAQAFGLTTEEILRRSRL